MTKVSTLDNADFRIGDLWAMQRHMLALEKKINDLEIAAYGMSALYNDQGRLVSTNSPPYTMTRTYDSNGNIATQDYGGTRITFVWERIGENDYRLVSSSEAPIG